MNGHEELSGVIVYGVGFVVLSVCHPADMALDDVLDVANREHMTGLDHGWMPSLAPHFASGEPNPCPCERDPGRVHRLLEC